MFLVTSAPSPVGMKSHTVPTFRNQLLKNPKSKVFQIPQKTIKKFLIKQQCAKHVVTE